MTANTIDEKIVERAAAKRRLEKLVIHQKKFKSQDISGLKTTMEAISPSELLSLLNSKDHAGVVDRKDGMIFSQEELDALLDRSELAWNKQSENPGKEKFFNDESVQQFLNRISQRFESLGVFKKSPCSSPLVSPQRLSVVNKNISKVTPP